MEPWISYHYCWKLFELVTAVWENSFFYSVLNTIINFSFKFSKRNLLWLQNTRSSKHNQYCYVLIKTNLWNVNGIRLHLRLVCVAIIVLLKQLLVDKILDKIWTSQNPSAISSKSQLPFQNNDLLYHPALDKTTIKTYFCLDITSADVT